MAELEKGNSCLGIPGATIGTWLKQHRKRGMYVVLSKRSVKQFVWAAVCLMTFAGSVNAFLANAQPVGGAGVPNAAGTPKMRTRLLTSLTGYEIDNYLKRNDVIFIPVGPTEVNGGNPTDVEYVIPLAYAIKLAEKSDGLVLPYLAYFYPGSTTISHGTVMVTPEEGLQYLKVVSRSLIRQGFRRIVFLSSHGPSGDTLHPLVREIFDETHVPVVWMDCGGIAAAGRSSTGGQAGAGRPSASVSGTSAAVASASGGMEEMFTQRRSITYGAYLAVGRLDNMPIDFAVPHHEFDADPSTTKLSRLLGGPIQSDYGRFYSDPSEHGGWPTPVTAEQRQEWGKQGLQIIESQVSAYDVMGMLDALRQHDQFTKTLEKKYGNLLPPGPPNP
jgi:creatinine amidohydrolase